MKAFEVTLQQQYIEPGVKLNWTLNPRTSPGGTCGLRFGNSIIGVPSHLVPRPLGTRISNGGCEAGYSLDPPTLSLITVIPTAAGGLNFAGIHPDDNRAAVIVHQLHVDSRKQRFVGFWCNVPDAQIVQRAGDYTLMIILNPGETYFFQTSIEARLPRSRATRFKPVWKKYNRLYSIGFDGVNLLAQTATYSAPKVEAPPSSGSRGNRSGC